MESKILVTGGKGYIDSHTLIKLIENELELVVLDNLSNSKLEILNRITKLTHKKFDFVKGGITDRNIKKKF